MTAKEYLKQIKSIEHRIERIREHIALIESEMSGMKSPDYSADRVQSSKTSDKLIKLISRYDSEYRRLVSEWDHLLRTRTKICSQIEALTDERYKQILFAVYVNHLTWDEVAESMSFTRRWVEILHGRALKEFDGIRKSS